MYTSIQDLDQGEGEALLILSHPTRIDRTMPFSYYASLGIQVIKADD
jgi:hypothetical protein